MHEPLLSTAYDITTQGTKWIFQFLFNLSKFNGSPKEAWPSVDMTVQSSFVFSSEQAQRHLEAETGYFVFDDRDWFLFRYILAFLRDRTLPTDEELALRLYNEAGFWGLRSLEQALQSRTIGSLGYREVLSKMKKPQLKKLLIQLKKARKNSRPLDDVTYLEAATIAQKIAAPEWWMQAPDWWDRNELEKAVAEKERKKEENRLEELADQEKAEEREKKEAEIMFWFDSGKKVNKVDYSKAGRTIDPKAKPVSAVMPQAQRLGYVDRHVSFITS